MSKNIKNSRDKIKYLLFTILLTQLQADNYINRLQDNDTKSIHFKDFGLKEKKNIEKIIEIKSLKQLLKELNIKDNQLNLKDKKINKILSDININRYTLTYLIYNKITKKIDNIDIGGEFIALIHIKTDSKNDYKKTEKFIGKKTIPWNEIEKFKKRVDKISKTHLVTYKNIILADDTILPANNLSDIIDNAKKFQNDINNHEIIYRESNRSDLNSTTINRYISLIEKRNNLEYIRRNQNEFSNEVKIERVTAQSKKITKILNNIENNSSTKESIEITYPKRYESFNNNSPISIEPINLPEKQIEKKYPKIIDDTNLSLKYDFKLELKNSGKVILLKWIKRVKEDNKLIHQDENSKIILDSYINFKGLKATEIKDLKYGSIEYKTKFDHYEKNESIKGFGIIDNAVCGYSIKDKNGTFEFCCKNIKIKKLDIDFIHSE